MSLLTLEVNGVSRTVDVPPDTPLLWVLRDELGLLGTKFSCGMSVCGSCTVHLDGSAVRSCTTPVAGVAGRSVTTIEGLMADAGNPLRRAWLEEDVPQCGYCQPGQIMQAAALLTRTPTPSTEEIDRWMAGNLCRCGTYLRIRNAIRRAAGEVSDER